MKNERIECTLQEAIELCEKNGGSFRIDNGESFIVDANGCVVWDYDRQRPFELEVGDFKIIWIYEPPKRSAFQKWESSEQSKIVNGLNDTALRKQGWNAAIDAVLELPSGLDKLVERIQKLKEP
jgi:hypothetical protein